MAQASTRYPGRRTCLQIEGLESRQVLAGDGLWLHNPGNPEDANLDGVISPGDALIVINRLNSPSGGDAHGRVLPDIDGDGTISPRDALLIINRLNTRSPLSGVAPSDRADRLRAAIDSGRLPPHLSSQEAREMLETLERGGRWELGERFRDGRIVNIRAGEGELQLDTSEPVIPPTPIGPGELTEQDDEEAERRALEPFQPLRQPEGHAPALLDEVVRLTEASNRQPAEADAAMAEAAAAFYRELGRQFVESPPRGDLFTLLNTPPVRALRSALPLNGNSSRDLGDVVRQLEAARDEELTRLAQIFSQFEVGSILEQIRVDLSTLLAARSDSTRSVHEAVFADLVRGAAVSMF